jgi:hypothetical protein
VTGKEGALPTRAQRFFSVAVAFLFGFCSSASTVAAWAPLLESPKVIIDAIDTYAPWKVSYSRIYYLPK